MAVENSIDTNSNAVVDDLVAANPVGSTSEVRELDNHIRGLKNILIKMFTSLGDKPLLENLIDVVYPVGAIYMSVANTSPETLFGGTWTAIQTGRMLISEDGGTTYTAGDTGGSKDAIVVAHQHSVSGTTGGGGAHDHTMTGNRAGAGTKELPAINANATTNVTVDTDALSAAIDHTHTFSATSGSTGSAGTNANMPPYLAVYMWKRTA